jgi:hypothetical protein
MKYTPREEKHALRLRLIALAFVCVLGLFALTHFFQAPPQEAAVLKAYAR